MIELFKCPGFCEDCKEKDCPVRGKLDDGFKRNLSEFPDGQMLINMYELIKKLASPENIATILHDDLLILMRDLKSRMAVGIILDESQVENKIIKLVSKRVNIYRDDYQLDVRDQSVKKFKYSVHQLALKINEHLAGKCNDLFCGTCYINIICDKIARISDVRGNA